MGVGFKAERLIKLVVCVCICCNRGAVAQGNVSQMATCGFELSPKPSTLFSLSTHRNLNPKLELLQIPQSISHAAYVAMSQQNNTEYLVIYPKNATLRRSVHAVV